MESQLGSEMHAPCNHQARSPYPAAASGAVGLPSHPEPLVQRSLRSWQVAVDNAELSQLATASKNPHPTLTVCANLVAIGIHSNASAETSSTLFRVIYKENYQSLLPVYGAEAQPHSASSITIINASRNTDHAFVSLWTNNNKGGASCSRALHRIGPPPPLLAYTPACGMGELSPTT